jgi:hypothetical protein
MHFGNSLTTKDSYMFARRPLFLAVALIIAREGCTQHQTDRKDADTERTRKVAPMIQVIADSPSIVMRSTHILLFRVEASQLGAWGPRPEGGTQRDVQLTIKLEELLKGKTKETTDSVVKLQVKQYGTGTSRVAAMPGVWSNHELAPKAQYVAFCNSRENNTAALLQDPSCERLQPAGEALADVRLALQSEAENMPIKGLFALAKPMAAKLHYTFAEYAWQRFDASNWKQPENFEQLMEFLEFPALSDVTRSTLLDLVYSRVSNEPDSGHRVPRLAITMFRLLRTPEASKQHDNIIKPFLPNLLGLSGGATKRTPDEIFVDFPGERPKALQSIREYQGAVPVADLVAWLR